MWRCILVTLSWALSISSSPSRDECSKNEFRVPITLISDQDSLSKLPNISEWYSLMRMGDLYYNKATKEANITWLLHRNYTSFINFSGRGMEFSDLIYYDGKLLTIDDKTGIVYWLRYGDAIPIWIITDMDGKSTKPFKGEWMTQKDSYLYIGSTGNEDRTPNGEVFSYDSLYVKKISSEGLIEHIDWFKEYHALRDAVQTRYPGYMLHESGQWSEIHKKWFFLPRHMSKHSYHPRSKYSEGANVLISTSDCFCDATFVEVGVSNTTRGFSAFQFVPCTNDEVILAVKSEEVPNMPLKSFIMMFTIDGEIILNDTELAGNYKFEGIEFYDALRFRDERDTPSSAGPTLFTTLFCFITVLRLI